MKKTVKPLNWNDRLQSWAGKTLEFRFRIYSAVLFIALIAAGWPGSDKTPTVPPLAPRGAPTVTRTPDHILEKRIRQVQLEIRLQWLQAHPHPTTMEKTK